MRNILCRRSRCRILVEEDFAAKYRALTVSLRKESLQKEMLQTKLLSVLVLVSVMAIRGIWDTQGEDDVAMQAGVRSCK
jgi:hypothetical protein